MKYLYLIRHAKSSWADLNLADYDRPLNKRGKTAALKMADRITAAGISFDLIVASPAKRARATARRIAKRTGYTKKDIVYYKSLYLTDTIEYAKVVKAHLRQVDCLALVGHNETITSYAEYLTGEDIYNIPTAGIVGISLVSHKAAKERGGGKMLFFDYPKNLESPLLV